MMAFKTRPYKLFIFGILLFLFLFTIKFSFLPIGTVPIYALLGLSIFILNLSKRINYVIIPKQLLNLLLSYLFLIIALFIALIINNTFDFGLILFFTKTPILVFFATWFLVYLAYRWQISLNVLLKMIVFLYFIQMVCVTIFFLNPHIAYNALSLIDMGERMDKITKELIGFRAFGFGFGYDFGTAQLTCALIIAIYLYFTEERRYIKYLYITLYSCLIGIFVARTMFISIAFLFLFFIFFPSKYKYRKAKAFLLFILLVFLLVSFLITYVDFKKYETTIQWVFEFFTHSLTNKQETTGSLHILLNDMLFYPGDKTFIIGDGLFGTDKYYMGTDIGFMRLILYFGILGLLSFFVYSHNIRQCLFNKPNQYLKLVAIGLLIFQYIFLWKILFLFDSYYFLFISYYIFPYFHKSKEWSLL